MNINTVATSALSSLALDLAFNFVTAVQVAVCPIEASVRNLCMPKPNLVTAHLGNHQHNGCAPTYYLSEFLKLYPKPSNEELVSHGYCCAFLCARMTFM